ncbi:ribbon-helix-helix protein, CopG family [Devosia sp. MC532]|uniref:CopG family ribbon-helix-helix protein n=1 Tax=Devosia sp. MC532 TaxID=2799788 RepID=UPI0018F75E10|nr:ribbon-helix-helix protein, CopG family [Devosia sp. MC532]MBJ7577433.1 ribbon-helix-helix protein, CopG family [Devosia sp. MC532]
MSNTNTTFIISLSSATKAKLEHAASLNERSESALIEEALTAYLDHEDEIVRSIKQALDDAAHGRVVDHNVAMTELERALRPSSGH